MGLFTPDLFVIFLLFNNGITLKALTGIYLLQAACSNEKSNPGDSYL